MIALIIVSIVIFVLINLVLLYYNYMARFQRIQLYGDKTNTSTRYSGLIPAIDVTKLIRDRAEQVMHQLLMKRHLPLTVCLGDSITHGIISTNYVNLLQERFKDKMLFLNSGINGNLAYNLNERLYDDCIAFDPDYVTILIGTNDANSQQSSKIMKKYVKTQKLPQKPDKDFYKSSLETIILRLKKETHAKIAILSLPVIGEELDSEINRTAEEYSSIIKELTDKYKLTYLPLNEQQRDYLKSIEKRTPTPYLKKNFFKLFSLMIKRSFDRIAELNNRYLTYDGLHATTLGAKMIEENIKGFLDKSLK